MNPILASGDGCMLLAPAESGRCPIGKPTRTEALFGESDGFDFFGNG